MDIKKYLIFNESYNISSNLNIVKNQKPQGRRDFQSVSNEI